MWTEIWSVAACLTEVWCSVPLYRSAAANSAVMKRRTLVQQMKLVIQSLWV